MTRRIFFAAVSLALVAGVSLWSHAPAQAQDAVAAVRRLERCVAEQQAHLGRVLRLIDEAEQRTSSSDPAVARDAREAIVALVHRAHEVRTQLERCLRDNPVPDPTSATSVVREPAEGESEARVSSAGDTVEEVHPPEPIGRRVRVVRGERVDGRGAVPPEDLRRAVRTHLGPALDRCYAAYVDRASERSAEIEVSFAAVDGTIREATLERLGPFDGALRACVVSAVSTIPLRHARGRAVFAYVFALGP